MGGQNENESKLLQELLDCLKDKEAKELKQLLDREDIKDYLRKNAKLCVDLVQRAIPLKKNIHVFEALFSNEDIKKAINLANDGVTSLIIAIEANQIETVKFLLDQGANPFIADLHHGYSPKTLAQGTHKLKIAKLLAVKEKEVLQPQNKASQEKSQEKAWDQYSKQVELIKRFGHSLGLTQKISIRDPNADTQVIDTEGSYTSLSIEQLNHDLQNFVKTIGASSPSKSAWESIEKAFIKEEEYLSVDELKTENDLIQDINQGILTTIPCGWRAHAFTLAVQGDYLIVSNRGAGGRGVDIYKLTEVEKKILLTKGFIASLKDDAQLSGTDVLDRLKRIIPQANYVTSIYGKTQRHGTCSFVNAKSITQAILYLQFLETFEAKAKAAQGNPDLLKALAEENLETEEGRKSKAKVMAKKEYKQFTLHMREQEVKEIIKGIEKNDANLKVYQEIAIAYLKQHFKNPEISPSKESKRTTELNRALKLLEALDEPSRKAFLSKLDIENPELFNLARRYSNKALIDLIKQYNPSYGFFEAVLAQDMKTANEWLQKGANPNIIVDDKTVLRFVILSDVKGIEKTKLLEEVLNVPGINVNLPDKHGNTPLVEAVKQNFVDAVDLLIKKGADPNVENVAGLDLLFLCALYQVDNKITAQIIEHNKHKLNAPLRGQPPLYHFIDVNNLEAVKLLLKAGASVLAKSAYHASALVAAQKTSNPELIALIEKATEIEREKNLKIAGQRVDLNENKPKLINIENAPDKNLFFAGAPWGKPKNAVESHVKNEVEKNVERQVERQVDKNESKKLGKEFKEFIPGAAAEEATPIQTKDKPTKKR